MNVVIGAIILLFVIVLVGGTFYWTKKKTDNTELQKESKQGFLLIILIVILGFFMLYAYACTDLPEDVPTTTMDEQPGNQNNGSLGSDQIITPEPEATTNDVSFPEQILLCNQATEECYDAAARFSGEETLTAIIFSEDVLFDYNSFRCESKGNCFIQSQTGESWRMVF